MYNAEARDKLGFSYYTLSTPTTPTSTTTGADSTTAIATAPIPDESTSDDAGGERMDVVAPAVAAEADAVVLFDQASFKDLCKVQTTMLSTLFFLSLS